MSFPEPVHSYAPKKRPVGVIVAWSVLGGLVFVVGAGVVVGLTRDPKPTSAAPAVSAAAAPRCDYGHAADGSCVASPTPPPPEAPAAAALGRELSWDDGLKVTAYHYKANVAKGAPKPVEAGYESGYVWAAIDVQVCAPIDGFVNTLPWHLAYADNTTLDPSNTGYNQFPKPEYPWGDRQVSAGTCIRGWITFAVPSDKKPIQVVYDTESHTLVKWAIS